MSYRFREAREKAGLSAAEVGRRIGVSQPAVTQWETGAKVPSVEMLCKLADLYCVSTDYLLGRDEQVESIPFNDDMEKMRSFILPDQDILTVMHGEQIRLADTMRYNLSDRLIRLNNADPGNEKIDLQWVREHAAILHFLQKEQALEGAIQRYSG